MKRAAPFEVRSNMKRSTSYRFLMEMQMEYSFEKNVSISSGWMFASDSVSLPRLDNPAGACPTHRRQWADFLVSLMAPLHRQYKTARTELAGICYWKQGRCRLRQRLRAVMFCSEVAIRDTHKSPKIVCWLADTLRECSKLGKTRIITDVSCGMVRNTGFCGQNLPQHVYLELLSI